MNRATKKQITDLIVDRRFIIAILALLCLTFLGYRGMDVADAIAFVSIGLGLANGGEKALKAFAASRSTYRNKYNDSINFNQKDVNRDDLIE